jgi:hypothetical protein
MTPDVVEVNEGHRLMCGWILASLLVAGCATDKQEVSVTGIDPDPSADRRVEAPPATPPMDRPSQPPAQEQAKKTPPAAPRQDRQEKGEARREPPPTREAEQRATGKPEARTEERAAQKPEQQAKASRERVTPMDQSGSSEDVEITRRIRKALMNEDLSFGAKNVLVITEQDRVVLKGTVNSPSEADRVKRVAGMMTTKHIDDRLEVGRQ